MAHFKSPEKKATETVTFRLTIDERQLLSHLATLKELSMTDLLRQLLAEEASRLQVEEIPSMTPPKRAGRPKKQQPESPKSASLPVDPPPHFTFRHSDEIETIGDLVDRFKVSFADRAEGTQKELDNALHFFCGIDGDRNDPLLSFDLPLSAITSAKLQEVRQTVASLDIRMAKKNLHLTYLRMMVHFAVKQSAVTLSVNPSEDLKGFTITELPQSWPGRYK
ncbi:MAG: hypothetical protein QNJ97_13260 [Myxococcota bacterium]|nr:hypothetical protein [Myxococcota bacterium]